MERLKTQNRKCIFSPEEKEYIKSSWEHGKSTQLIGEEFGCSHTTISNILKKAGIKAQNIEKFCKICKEEFITKNRQQIYCHNPCNSNYCEERKDSGLKYHYIKVIRKKFYKLINSNPEKALILQKEMEEEEGKEFKDMVLDGITQKEEFEKMDKIYKKYKHLWKEGEVI